MAKIISVTAADIKKGRANIKKGLRFSENCAICVALNRTFKTTGATWASSSGKIGGRYYRSLTETHTFESNHDIGNKVKPFRFKIVQYGEN